MTSACYLSDVKLRSRRLPLSIGVILGVFGFLPSRASAMTRLWNPAGVQVSGSGLVSQGGQRVSPIPDGSGGVYVLWADSGGFSSPDSAPNGNAYSGNTDCNSAPCPNMNLYVAHYSSAGARVSFSGSGAAQSGGVLLITDRSDLNQIAFSAYGAGGFAVSWSTSAANTTGAEFVQSYNSGGTPALSGGGDGALFGGLTANNAKLYEQGGGVGSLTIVGSIFYFLNVVGCNNGPCTAISVSALDLTTGGTPAGFPSAQLASLSVLATLNGGGMAVSQDAGDPGVIVSLVAHYSGGLANDIHAWRFNSSGMEWGGSTAYAVTNGASVRSGNGSHVLQASAGDGTNNVYIVWYDTQSVKPGFYGFKLGSALGSPSPSSGGGTLLFTPPSGADGGFSGGGSEIDKLKAAGNFEFAWDTNTVSNSSWSGNENLAIVNPSMSVVLNTVVFYGNNPSIGVSGTSGNPTFWAAWGPCNNGGNCSTSDSNSAVQAWNSSGASIFTSTTVLSGSVGYQNPQTVGGTGDNLAVTLNAYSSCPPGGGTCSSVNEYIALLSTDVAPTPPNALTLTGQTSASLSFSWSGTGALGFELDVSTDNSFGVAVSSVFVPSGTNSATIGGLQSDTLYYARVGTRTSGAPLYGATISGNTAAAPVQNLVFAVAAGSITAQWFDPNYPRTTSYSWKISDNAFYNNPYLSSGTLSNAGTPNPSLTFAGLSQQTTYYIEISVDNSSFVQASTMTAKGLGALPPVVLSSTAVTEQWATNGLPPGTVYRVDIATDPIFGTLTNSSVTANAAATFSGLSPNTTYYGQVKINPAGLYVALPSTMTALSPPGVVSPAFPAVGTLGLTVNWTSGGNPGILTYDAQISTNSNFVPLWATSTTLNTSAAFGSGGQSPNLSPNATYYAQVRISNNGSGASSYFVNLGSTQTVATMPTVAAYSSIGANALTANWGANGSPAGTVYAAQLFSDAGLTVLVASTTTTALNAAFAGLSVNTTYYGSAAAYSLNAHAYTSFTPLGITSTLANVPTSQAVTLIDLTHVTLGWNANGNPAGTLYTAQISMDPAFATISASNIGVAVSAAFAGLASNTTYFLRVEASNTPGVLTAFAVAAASSTKVAVPVAASPTGVTVNSVAANWTANGDSPTTQYVVQIATDPAFGSFNSSITTALTAATFSGLAANTGYFFRVEALGNDGTVTAFVALPSTSTLLLPPAATSPALTGVTTTAATANWGSGGNGLATVYNAQISTDNFTSVFFTSATANLFAAFGAGGAGPALSPNSTYYFRVQSSTSSNSSAYLTIGSTITPTAAPTAVAAVFTAVGIGGLTVGYNGNNPPGTTYRVELATSNAFMPVAFSSQTLNASAAFTGLTANTTYFARVAPFSLATGGFGAFVVLGSTATTATAPSAVAYSAIGANALTANWGANGSPAGTVYAAKLFSDSGLTVLIASTTTTGLSAAFAGLSINTTYYGSAAAYSLNAGAYTSFTPLGQAWTLANAPTAAAATAVGLTQVTLGWNANGNPGGTAYTAQISTDPAFATITASSVGTAAPALFTGLASNTTYFTRVNASNTPGVLTVFAVAAATSTTAAVPLSAAPTSVTVNSVAANWTANGDSPTTQYVVQIATDPAFGSFNSSITTALTAATFSGLAANTGYFFRVEALGNDGTVTAFVALPSTSTLLLPPAATSPALTGVTTTAATANWGSGGNGLATVYNAQISTDNFTSVFFTSATANLFAAFGAGGAGPALSPNSTYYFRVQSSTSSNSSAYLTIGSTITPSFAPTGTGVLSVTSTTVVNSWSANGNPVGTTYELWRDLTGAFAAPVKTIVSTTNYQSNALAPNTTYFFQVRTLGFGGTYTAFDSAVSTATLPPAPGSPGTPVGAAAGVSSITWTWSAAQYASSYKTLRAASGAVIASTPTLAFFDAGLATNTAYGLVVQGLNATGLGLLSNSATVYTLAAPPAGSVVNLVAATSATLSWSLNTNPALTMAEIQRSTDGVSFTSLGSSFTSTSIIDYSLLGCSTYYYRVRNLNGNALLTSFDAVAGPFVTSNTVPSPASALTATAMGGNRIAFAWTPSPTEGITGYDLFYDAGAGSVNYAAPLASLVGSATTYLTGVLTSSAAYNFALRAKQRCGVEETGGVFATAAATATVSALRAAIANPASGRHVAGNGLTIAAALTSGSPDQVRQILFQYRTPSGSGPWTSMTAADFNHPNPVTAEPYFIHWNVGALPAGSYDLRAVAVDVAGSTDTVPDVVTLVNDPATPSLTENIPGGVTQVFDTGVLSTFFVGGSNIGDPLIKIVMPPNAVSAVSGSTVSATVAIVTPSSISTSPPGGFAIMGNLVMRVILTNAQSSTFASGSTAQVAFGYAGSLGLNPQIWSLNEMTGVWSHDCTTAVDSVNSRISCNSAHFTVFAVMTGGAAASDLGGVRVYPIPYKPNGGDANQGGGGTGIFFDRMPASASIKIYTATGRLVTSFDASSPSGKVVWDARNGSGRDVATGFYVAVISSPGQAMITKKILIVR